MAKKREKPRGNRGFLLRNPLVFRHLLTWNFKRRARESNPQPAKPASDFESGGELALVVDGLGVAERCLGRGAHYGAVKSGRCAGTGSLSPSEASVWYTGDKALTRTMIDAETPSVRRHAAAATGSPRWAESARLARGGLQ
jgi:hypothetical protein